VNAIMVALPSGGTCQAASTPNGVRLRFGVCVGGAFFAENDGCVIRDDGAVTPEGWDLFALWKLIDSALPKMRPGRAMKIPQRWAAEALCKALKRDAIDWQRVESLLKVGAALRAEQANEIAGKLIHDWRAPAGVKSAAAELAARTHYAN
jgi:hypothetical protein